MLTALGFDRKEPAGHLTQEFTELRNWPGGQNTQLLMEFEPENGVEVPDGHGVHEIPP